MMEDVTEAFPSTDETFEEAKIRYINFFGNYPFNIEDVKKAREETKYIHTVQRINEYFYSNYQKKQ